MPYIEIIRSDDEFELIPNFNPDADSLSDDEMKKHVQFDGSINDKTSFKSGKNSVATCDLFTEADPILYEGDLMKFKPGISQNFLNRYVQVSLRAFRYFRNQYDAMKGKPIVAFRKKIIEESEPYQINKASYLKPGSRIAQSKKEDHLFDFAFEVKLNEHYEDNYLYRNMERAVRRHK